MEKSIFLKFESLKGHGHICHFYSTNVESLEIGTYFLSHGIRNREKCFYISDKILPQEFLYRLKGRGIDIDGIYRGKTFEEITILGKERQNMGDQNSFLQLLRPKVERALESGKRVRILKKKAFPPYSSTDLLWREALLDKSRLDYPFLLMCQYDIKGISFQDAISLFKTHPMIVVDNKIYDSSFYTPPDEILADPQVRYNTYSSLTYKERTVLRCIVNGKSSRAIAMELSMSLKMVEVYRRRIRRKLRAGKIVDLVKIAISNGIG